MTQDDVQHPTPVWRERADFVIGAQLPEAGRAEQLWARQLGSTSFEVCCVPFFVYDVALGDVVETDDAYNFVRVTTASGRFVFRVWFGSTSYPREPVAGDLAKAGALLEWSSDNLLAVDAADRESAAVIAAYLSAQERKGRLVYENGRSRT